VLKAVNSETMAGITEHMQHVNWKLLLSSNPSIFSLVGSFPPGIVASHSFHCCITVSSCVSVILLVISKCFILIQFDTEGRLQNLSTHYSFCYDLTRITYTFLLTSWL